MGTAAFFFAVMSVFAKIAGKEVSFAEMVFVRGVVGLLILIPMVVIKKVDIRGNNKKFLLIRSIFGTIAMLLFFYALNHIPVANALLLNQSAPLFVLPLAYLYLREKITMQHVSFIVLAFCGVSMVVRPTYDFINLPGLAACLSAFFAAPVYVLLRQMAKTEHPLTVVFWFTCISTLASMFLMIPVFVFPGPRIWLALLFMGTFAVLGQILMTHAYHYAEAGKLAVIGSLGAVFGAGFDFIVWNHVPDLLTMAGGVIVIFSCGAIQLLRAR